MTTIDRDPGDECDVCHPPSSKNYKASYRIGHGIYTTTLRDCANIFDATIRAGQDLREGETLIAIEERLPTQPVG